MEKKKPSRCIYYLSVKFLPERMKKKIQDDWLHKCITHSIRVTLAGMYIVKSKATAS